MKKILPLLSLLAIGAAFQSCDNASTLSKELDGSWSGAPEPLFDSGASSATIIETWTFAPSDSSDTSGSLILTALTSVTGSISGAEGISVPVSVTASGYATVTGTWEALSVDRVNVALDPSSMTVKVDPDAVIINADVIGDAAAAPNVATLRPQLAESIKTQMEKAVSQRYADINQLTSVSVTDNSSTLKFKVNKTSYSLTRQNQ
ncbi:MAG: hypothetical protein HDS92_00300 [Bacteroidales bacterium]|nr:hypothetical protein [Bacteroidales bacterium]